MRVFALILFVLIVLLWGLLFWPFILNDVIKPISLVAWLFLRTFVLSIDQKYYWGAIIFVALLCLFRILRQAQLPGLLENSRVSPGALNANVYWYNLYTVTKDNIRDKTNLKRELVELLLSFYSSKQNSSSNFEIYDALQRGEIPLPEHIHTFLFLQEPKQSGRSLKNLLQSMRNTPTKWIRRWMGQETAEYYRMIDEVLSFMETSLEMKNDDGTINPTKY